MTLHSTASLRRSTGARHSSKLCLIFVTQAATCLLTDRNLQVQLFTMVKVGGNEISLDQGINLAVGAAAVIDGAACMLAPNKAQVCPARWPMPIILSVFLLAAPRPDTHNACIRKRTIVQFHLICVLYRTKLSASTVPSRASR